MRAGEVKRAREKGQEQERREKNEETVRERVAENQRGSEAETQSNGATYSLAKRQSGAEGQKRAAIEC